MLLTDVLPRPQGLVPRKANEQQVLVVASAGLPLSLDPAKAIDGDSFKVTVNIFDTLVEYEPKGTGLKPALAADWRISESGLIYTFNLRQGVRFHDGTDFDSGAVLANFLR